MENTLKRYGERGKPEAVQEYPIFPINYLTYLFSPIKKGKAILKAHFKSLLKKVYSGGFNPTSLHVNGGYVRRNPMVMCMYLGGEGEKKILHAT